MGNNVCFQNGKNQHLLSSNATITKDGKPLLGKDIDDINLSKKTRIQEYSQKLILSHCKHPNKNIAFSTR